MKPRLEIQIHDARAALDGIACRARGDDGPTRPNRDRAIAMVEFLRAVVRPPLEDPDHLQSLGGELLVLRGSAEQQVSLLEALRALESPLEDTSVDGELVVVSRADFVERLAPLLGWTEVPARDAAAVGQVVLDDAAARKLRQGIAKLGDATVKDVPRLELAPVERGSFSDTSTIYYRRDYEVEVTEEKVTVWPITGKLKEGLALQVTCAPVSGAAVGVLVDGALASVERPIPTFKTSLAGRSDEVVLDLPTTTIRHLNGGLRLRAGELGVLVNGTAGDGEVVLLLVRAVR